MKKLNILILVIATIFTASCEKAAKDEPYGFSLIYMPQAVLQSAGIGNNYTVTVKRSTATDTSVVVGAYRSGLEELSTFSVDLTVDSDSLAQTILAAQQAGAPASLNLYKNAKLLPASYYTLPAKINVPNGQRESFVLLNLKKELLLNDPEFGSKVFILPVRITNPTKYELQEKLSLTMFVFRNN